MPKQQLILPCRLLPVSVMLCVSTILVGCGAHGSSGGGPSPAPPPTPITTNPAVVAKNLYVCDGENTTVDVYAANQSGPLAPTATYSYSPGDPIVAVTGDAAGNLYLGFDDADTGGHIEVFAPTSHIPARTITLPDTGDKDTNQINTITTDADGNLYVAAGANIFTFGPMAGDGAAPTRTISGSKTTLGSYSGVTQMAVDTAGELYVAEGGGNVGSQLVKFPAAAAGNVAPTLITDSTYLPVGVALDAEDNIYIAQSEAEFYQAGGYETGIFEFPAGSVAGAKPIRTITGAAANFGFYLHDLQVDKGGNIFVRIYLAEVLVFDAKASGNVAPASTIQLIAGDSTDSQMYLQ